MARVSKKFFTIDARAMLSWGRESIKDHTTALVELVKNSYDAGSSICEIEISFEEADPHSWFIRISDNGHGMSENELDRNWLRIGFSGKREEKRTRNGRRRTGEKGVGRISADRLGSKLTLKSQKNGCPPCGLIVDWNSFEQPGRELHEVPVRFVTPNAFGIPKPTPFESAKKSFGKAPDPVLSSQRRSGTELHISNLRDRWGAQDISALREALMVLTPPFEEVNDFQIRIKSPHNKGAAEVIESPFIETAEVEGVFRLFPDGRVSMSLVHRDKQGKKERPVVRKLDWNQFVHPARIRRADDDERRDNVDIGPVEARFLFFPREADTLRGTDLVLSDLREFLRTNAGIKVYRDGIRVMPYGDPTKPEGDWLGLGDRKARNPAGAARADFRVSPLQLVGAVYLTRDDNPEIADTSSREGLIQGDAFHRLASFLMGGIVHLEGYYHQVFSARKESSSDAVVPRDAVNDLKSDLQHLTENLGELRRNLPKTQARHVERTLDLISKASDSIKTSDRSIDELASQAIVYRGLATLGIASATFGHETLGSIEGVEIAIGTAKRLMERRQLDVESVVEELEKSLRYAARISAWGRFALERVKKDKRRRRKLDIKPIVTAVLGDIKIPFDGASIDVKSNASAVEASVFPMDIEAILVNLLTNAYFFAKQSRKRVIKVVLRPRRGGFELSVSDSGPGIPAKTIPNIWEPLFTTRVDTRGRQVGTGLGLAIVDSIVRDYGGTREVSKDTELGGAKISIWIPSNHKSR